MNKTRAAMKRAQWLKSCLDIGYPKESLPRLEEVWDRFKDENGNLRDVPKGESGKPEPVERNEQITLLESFGVFLEKHGYLDTDWRTEPPYAIDEFLNTITKKQHG